MNPPHYTPATLRSILQRVGALKKTLSAAWLAVVLGAVCGASSAVAQTAPSNFSVTTSILDNTTFGYRINWADNSSDESAFQIDLSAGSSSNWQFWAYASPNSTTFASTFATSLLPPGTVVYFRVSAIKGNYNSSTGSFAPLTSWSAYAPLAFITWPNTTSGPFTFNAPAITSVNFVFNDATSNVLRVTFTDNSNAEDAFEFEARDTASGLNPFFPLTEDSFNLTQSDLVDYFRPGRTYEVRMRARSYAEGLTATTTTPVYTPYSNALTTTVTPGVVDIVPPAAPVNLTVAALKDASNPINYYYGVYWDDKSTDEGYFQIQDKEAAAANVDASYRSLGFLGGVSGVQNGIGTPLSGYIAGSTPSNKSFRVRASKGVGPFAVYSPFTNVVSAIMKPMDAPTEMRITSPFDDGKVQLFWSDNATDESGYEIEYRLGGSGGFTSLGSLASTSYSRYQGDGGIAGFPPSTQVEMRVRAFQNVNPIVLSNYSNTSNLVTTLPLAAPTNVQISAITKSAARVTWQDNSGNETNYQVLGRLTGNVNFQILLAGIPTVTTQATGGSKFVDLTGLLPGTGYDIIVRASYDYQDGSYIPGNESSIVPFVTKDAFTSNPYAPITLGVPFNYQATTTTVSPRVSWNITGLPPGLSFNTGNGQITGTPTVTGVFNATRTATFTDGTVDTDTFTLRIIPPSAAPTIGSAVGDKTIGQTGTFTFSLGGKFSDADSESAVRVNTTLGNIDVILYNTATPQTVANFLAYVNGGLYSDVAFHRAPPGFVVQGGGYKPLSAPANFTEVPDFAPAQNEPGISNLTGTIAMAKQEGNPNSATNEFFFNLGNNSANLDNQNSGFTAFARVSAPTMSVVNALAALPKGSYTIQIAGQSRGPFADWPMNFTPAPGTMDITKLAKINSATVIPVFTYAFTGNTNPAVVTPSISGSNMVLTPLTLGASTLTVRATDLDGNVNSQTFEVTVSASVTNNNNLASLVPSTGALSPVFTPGTTSYTVNVPFDATSIAFTPTVEDSTATVTVNALTVASGTQSQNISLNVGDTTISTIVKAQDNSTKTYTTLVTHSASTSEIAVEQPVGTDLTDGTASSDFGAVHIGATRQFTYTIRNLGLGVLGGIAITKDGANAADFTVSAPGSTSLASGFSTTFTVTFAPTTTLGARAAALHIASFDANENAFDINLAGNCISTAFSALTTSAGTLEPALNSTTTVFSVTLPTTTTSITVTPTLFDSLATMKVNDVTLASGVASAPISLTTGFNVISIDVTARDGLTVKSYAILAIRGDIKSQITSPANGSTLTSTTLPLVWNTGAGVTRRDLHVGTTSGGRDIYSGTETGFNRNITVPANGSKVYVTLWSLIGSVWQSSIYIYNCQASARAVLVSPSPANGSTLVGGTLNLTWNQGAGATGYSIYVGSAVGGRDIANINAGTALTSAIPVPQDGGPVYVTLWSRIGGVYQSESYWFITEAPIAGNRPARLTIPANTTTLLSTAVDFTWDAGVNVTRRDLWVGSSPDGYDLYKGANEAALTRLVTNLPGDGRRIYVTLHSLIGGVWTSNAYYFTATTSPSVQASQLTAPANGATLTSASLALTWGSVFGATRYDLYLGNAPMAFDIYKGNEGLNLSKTVTVPTDGRPIYLTLWTQLNGVWLQNTYWFTTQYTGVGSQKARINDPTPNGSVLAGTTDTFGWDTGISATNYALYVGTTPNGRELYSATDPTIRTRTLTTLPTDGRKIYVQLWSQIAGVWQSNSYLYTASNVTAKAAMTSPAPGTSFTSASVTFNWNAGVNVTQYWLQVGQTPGSSSVYAGSQANSLSKTLTNMPTNGGPIYVKLQSLINGAWQINEYIYTASPAP